MADGLPTGIRRGFGPEAVPGIREALDALSHFELLRGLTSGGIDDFILRFGAVADLVHADQTLWTLDALERRFVWMEPDRVHGVVRALRRSGWLETLGHEYRLTSEGLALYATLARLVSFRTGRDDDLAMGVFDLEASARLDEDVRPALLHLQHHLRRAIEDVEAAVASHSEVKVLEARERLDRNLEWSRRARQLLGALDVGEDEGYRAGQRLGRDLSELHRWHSVLQRALDEVSTDRLPLGRHGLRPRDLARFLAGLDVDDLLRLGGRWVHQPVWPLVAVTDNLLAVAEYELLFAETPDARTVAWRDEEADEAEVGEPPPTEGQVAFRAFERRVEALLDRGQPEPLDRFLAAGSFARACYHLTLLALEDERPDGRVRVEVAPGRGRSVYTDFLSEVSEGQVVPRGVPSA